MRELVWDVGGRGRFRECLFGMGACWRFLIRKRVTEERAFEVELRSNTVSADGLGRHPSSMPARGTVSGFVLLQFVEWFVDASFCSRSLSPSRCFMNSSLFHNPRKPHLGQSQATLMSSDSPSQHCQSSRTYQRNSFDVKPSPCPTIKTPSLKWKYLL